MEAMKSMNFRRIFFLGVLIGLGSATVAQAQFAAYGMVSAERVGGYICGETSGACASTDGKERPYGGTVGAFYDFRSFGPVRVGVDLRGNFLNASKSATAYKAAPDLERYNSGLGGLRATFRTPFRVLRPYAQVSGGFTRALREGGGQNYTQIQGLVGLDLALFENVDFRPIEFGIGELFGSSSHSIQSIGLGVVFHTTREK
jgi:hypothetical protein